MKPLPIPLFPGGEQDALSLRERDRERVKGR
jgi:hypothetical protein